MVVFRPLRRSVLLRLFVVAAIVLAFAAARAEACSLGASCCDDRTVLCPMLGPDGSTSAKSACKSLCAALPDGMATVPGASADDALTDGRANLAALVISGPEPPPPRFWQASL